MDAGLLKTLGQVLGIGGLAIGIFFLLFREIIRKSIFPTLKKDDAYKLLRMISVLIWSVAVIGIGAWIWGDRKAAAANSVTTTGPTKPRDYRYERRCPDRLQCAGSQMKQQFFRLIITVAWLFCATTSHAQDLRTQTPCSPVVDRTQGNVTLTFNGGCNAGITPAELKDIMEKVLAGRTIPAEWQDRYDMLSRTFGVTDTALTTFFRILGGSKVATEDLDAKLREVAARHLTLLKRAEPSGDDDPEVTAIKKEAVAAIALGNYARAEELLQRAFDTDLAVARRAQDEADKRLLAAAFRDGFARLAASGEEVEEVTQWYRRLRKDEPAEVWSGATAAKARLLALQSPPRVLHLATHGFYLAGESREPMLLSGIALAGANRELAGAGADGILFALEAQGLNLEGTELVVLSACGIAQGSLDYSEGVFGLARALRTAGARNVLVTLWKLNDGEARDFMVGFYKSWLAQMRSDPAKALRDTQLSWLKQDRRDPRVWAPYILIE